MRNRKCYGLKFNRQHIISVPQFDGSINYYIVDFYCYELKLIIELDGEIHLVKSKDDAWRSNELHQLGNHIMRFENEFVLNAWPSVKEQLLGFMQACKL